MRTLLGALVLIALSVAKAQEAPTPAAPAAETLEKDTSGLLVIQVSGHIIGFVFVSRTGQILPEPVGACEANEKCSALIKRLIDAQRVTTVSAGEAPEHIT